MSSRVGQTFGRYQLVEQLGEGGMATVYKAYDTRLDRYVAIKVILASQESSSSFLKRFEREARALARLSFPNIVNVHDYGEENGTPYLVMEYLPGGTLKQKMGRPLPYEEAARLLIPIAHALEHAHAQNIVHRDVKPANILMTESGQPMLSDFGIAKMLSGEQTTALTGVGVGIGTPEYMAPEQGRGLNIDHRADIYALGVVLYELVTGRKPYHGDTPMGIVLKHIQAPLPKARAYIPDLPEGVERIILHAMAKEPSQRYQSMKDFAADLENLLNKAAAQPGGPAAPTLMAADAQTIIQPPTPEMPPTRMHAVQPQTSIVPPEAAITDKRRFTWVWLALGGVILLGVILGGTCLLSSGALLAFSPTQTPQAPTLAAVDLTTPAAVHETAVPALDGQVISNLNMGIDTLDSYRINLSMSAGSQSAYISKEVVQSSRDFHTVFSGTNLTDSSGNETYDLYLVRGETWMFDPSAESCLYLGGSEIVPEIELFTLQSVASTLVLGPRVAEDEQINGTSADRYYLESITTPDGTHSAVPAADIWIDRQRGYIVRFNGSSEGAPELEDVPGETVKWEYNLYDPNGVFQIELPSNCRR